MGGYFFYSKTASMVVFLILCKIEKNDIFPR